MRRRRPTPAPRWQTPLPANVTGSYGPVVADYALRVLAIRLDRWQHRALNRALAHDRHGVLVHRHYLVSTGRQSGKTAIVRALIGAVLVEQAMPASWRVILGLAHDRGQARKPYDAVRVDLAAIRRRNPRELALTRYLGIRSDLPGRHVEYDIGSRQSFDAIRGSSVDLGLFDEVLTQRNYEVWAALEPTTRARPEPLIFATSTAGDDRSVLLRDWFDRGVRIIEGAEPPAGFGMTWYAAPDDLAPDDPKAILAANPSVAEGRVPIGPVAASIYSLSPQTYKRETLNLWSDGVDEWLPAGLWRDREAPRPAHALKVVLGVEAVPSWRRATVTVAVVTSEGVWVGVAGEIDATSSTVNPDQLVALVRRLVGEWHAPEIAYSSAAAAAPHLARLAAVLGVRPVPLGARQIRSASGLLRSELIGGRLTHAADALLAQQVRVARPSGPLEGADWYLSIPASLGEIDAIRAAAWAAWAAIAPEAIEVGPQIHV